jgi:flagellar motor protein MotB
MGFNRGGELAGRKRRGSPPDFFRAPEKDESEVRWLMSYSDFMMQLVCLFILLYSVSSVDTSKAVSLAQAWRDETGLGEVRLPSAGARPNVPLTSSDLSAIIEKESARNLKRTWVNNAKARDWTSPSSREFLAQSTEVKTIWVPYGEG